MPSKKRPPPPPPAQQTAAELGVVALRRREDLSGAPYEMTLEGLALVESWARDGASNTRVAAALGISRDALLAMRRRQPEVDERLAAGRSALELELVHHLLTAARSGQWVAALALGKTQLGWSEGREREGASTTVNVAISLPAALSPEEYRRSLAIDVAPALPAAKEEPDE